jgi:hypothetical protein
MATDAGIKPTQKVAEFKNSLYFFFFLPFLFGVEDQTVSLEHAKALYHWATSQP